MVVQAEHLVLTEHQHKELVVAVEEHNVLELQDQAQVVVEMVQLTQI
tara:strand:- start:14 stop:154 length:141 start_codon:yes stop_codon:yes gene_type:complete